MTDAPPVAPPTPPAPPVAPVAPVTPDLPTDVIAALAGLSDEQREALLKDTGKGALDKERQKAKDAAARATAAEAKLKTFEDAQLSAEQRAAADAQAATERAKAADARAVRAEVRALAATSFADPDDAPAFLDLTKYMSDSGDIDEDGIKADLAALLVRKPHLALASGGPRPPAPDKGQGRGDSGGSESALVISLKGQLEQALKDNNGTRAAVLRSQLSRAQLQDQAATT